MLAIGGHHSLILIKQRMLSDASESNDDEQFRGERKVFKYVNYVYAWGWNDKGQLGDASVETSAPATLIKKKINFIDQQFKERICETTGKIRLELIYWHNYSSSIIWIGAGDDHCMAISRNGLAFSWGDNSMGQCGQGHRLMRIYEPKVIEYFRENDLSASSGAIGRQHASIITQDGKPYIWGANAYVNLKIYPDDAHFYEPSLIPGILNRRAIQVCCGTGFNMVRVSIDSGIYVWGRNDCGQIAIKESFCDIPKFLCIENSLTNKLRVEKLAIGSDFAVACLGGISSKIYAWGLLKIYEEPKSEKENEKKPKLHINNPFAIKAAKKAAPKEKTKKELLDLNYKSWLKKAFREPIIVYHDLWQDDKFIDVTVTNDEIMVLNSKGYVFGMSYFELAWIKISNNFDLSNIVAENEKDDATQSKKDFIDSIISKDSLEPTLFSYRKLRPHCMQAISVTGTYNPISCGLLSVKHVKATSSKIKEFTKHGEQKLVHQTLTGRKKLIIKKANNHDSNLKKICFHKGDIVQLPVKSIKKQPVDEQEYSHMSLKPSTKTYKALPDSKLDQDLSPDPKLIKNMRI